MKTLAFKLISLLVLLAPVGALNGQYNASDQTQPGNAQQREEQAGQLRNPIKTAAYIQQALNEQQQQRKDKPDPHDRSFSVSFSASLSSNQTFTRPNPANNVCGHGTFGTFTSVSAGSTSFVYATQAFLVPTGGSGNYTIEATSSTASDPMLFLYTGSFSPSSPTSNFRVGDDDSGSGLLPKIACGNNYLTEGTIYVIVVTTYNPSTTSGTVNFTVSGPMSVTYLPTVSTGSASGITQTSATLAGNVTHDGGGTVSSRGIAWGTSPNPTSGTPASGTTGSFSVTPTTLTHGTTYYYRAYAVNEAGTAYGAQRTFRTQPVYPPTVVTWTPVRVGPQAFTMRGNVSSTGGQNPSQRGFSLSTSPSPPYSSTHTSGGGGLGEFTHALTGLPYSTTYYYRAYATNVGGTGWSSTVGSFTTDHQVTYNAGANGSVTNSGVNIVIHNGSISSTATPNTDYHFRWWSDGRLTATRTDNPVTSSFTRTAEFQPNILRFYGVPASTIAGDNIEFEVRIEDFYGNLMTNSDQIISIEISSSTPTGGTFAGGVGTKTATASGGKATFTFNSEDFITRTGNYRLRATSERGVLVEGTSIQFTVIPAALDYFTVEGIGDPGTGGTVTTTFVAGDPQSPTITAWDRFDNIKTNYTGTINFATNNGWDARFDGKNLPEMPADYTFTLADAGVKTFPDALVLKKTNRNFEIEFDNDLIVEHEDYSDDYYVRVTGADPGYPAVGTRTGTQSAIVIEPAVLEYFVLKTRNVLEEDGDDIVAGKEFYIDVVAYDRFDNVKYDYAGNNNLAFYTNATSSPNGTPRDIPPDGGYTFINGRALPIGAFTLYNSHETPTIGIIDIETGKFGEVTGIDVKNESIDNYLLEDMQDPHPAGGVRWIAGEWYDVRVTARDQYHNTVMDPAYPGGIQFFTSDANLTVTPTFSTYHYQPDDKGVKEFPMLASSPKTGYYWLRARSIEEGGVYDGYLREIFVGPNVFDRYESSFAGMPAGPEPAETLVDLVVTPVDAYGNLLCTCQDLSVLLNGSTDHLILNEAGDCYTHTEIGIYNVGDGTYTTTFQLTKAGTNTVTIRYNDAPTYQNPILGVASQTFNQEDDVMVNPLEAIFLSLHFGDDLHIIDEGTGREILDAGIPYPISIVARDKFGNIATGYVGVKSLVFDGAGSTPDINAATGFDPTITDNAGIPVPFGDHTPVAFDKGVGTATMTLYKDEAGIFITVDQVLIRDIGTATVCFDTNKDYRLPVDVMQKPVEFFAVTPKNSTQRAGTMKLINVRAYDQWNNLATLYDGDKDLVFSTDEYSVSPDGDHPTIRNKNGANINFGQETLINFNQGEALDLQMRLYRTGEYLINVKESGNAAINATNHEQEVLVTPASHREFYLTGISSHFYGERQVMKAEAIDFHGNIKTDYLRTVGFSSSDINADLPDPYLFTAADAGVQTFTMRFSTIWPEAVHSPISRWVDVHDIDPNVDIKGRNDGIYIEKRPIVISLVENRSKPYGYEMSDLMYPGVATNTFNISSGATPVLDPAMPYKIGSDSELESIESVKLYSYGAPAPAFVGSYTITIHDPEPGPSTDLNNYSIAFEAGELDVYCPEIFFENVTPTFTYTFANQEHVCGVTITFADLGIEVSGLATPTIKEYRVGAETIPNVDGAQYFFDVGTKTVTVLAENLCQEHPGTKSVIIWIKVEDSEAPRLTGTPFIDGTHYDACYEDAKDPLKGGAPAFSISNALLGYEDNCGIHTADLTDTNLVGDNCTWTLTYTYDVVDIHGNCLEDQYYVHTGGDITDPVWTVTPTNETVECDGAGNTEEFEAWLNRFEGTDNCSDAIVTHNYGTGENFVDLCGATGHVSVTFTLTDECGNYIKKAATFTIQDTRDPVWTVTPTNKTVECDGEGNITELTAWLNAPDGTDICGDATVTHNYGTGENFVPLCGATGHVSVTFTLTDDCGRFIQKAATFTIQDITNPYWTAEPQDLTVECDGSGNTAQLTAWLESFSGGDNCGIATVTHDYVPGNFVPACGATGHVDVTFTLTDECGRYIQKAATFTIEDTTPPLIAPMPNITRTFVTNDCGYTVNQVVVEPDLNFDPNVTEVCGNYSLSYILTGATEDNNTGDANLSLDHMWFNMGLTEVTWTATDECGNSSQATFTVNVIPATLMGSIEYYKHDAANFPMDNIAVNLLYDGSSVGTATTDAAGEFVISGLSSDANYALYQMELTSTWPHGGLSAVDALAVLRKATNLPVTYWEPSEFINHVGNVNKLPMPPPGMNLLPVYGFNASFILQRVVNPAVPFEAGDWAFYSEHHKEMFTNVNKNTARFQGLTCAIHARAYGDVRGQYPDPAGKGISRYEIQNNQVIHAQPGEAIEMPLIVNHDLYFNAMTLVMHYDSRKVELLGVQSAIPGMLSHIDDGIIRASFASLQETQHYSRGDALVYFKLRLLGDATPDDVLFTMSSLTEFADEDANIIPWFDLAVPGIAGKAEEVPVSIVEPADASSISLDAFPNPFRNELNVVFDLPASSDVHISIWNAQGVRVAEISQQPFEAGRHELLFEAGDYSMQPGIYFIRMTADDGAKTLSQTIRVVYMR